MNRILFRHANVFDGENVPLLPDHDVLVEAGIIRAVAPHGLPADGADVVECAGRALLPGLIDAHTHIYGASVNIAAVATAPQTYIAHYSAQFLRHSLDCGFTTIRDVGAGDIGAARALKEGLIAGPRLFYGGRALSQTAGHGDARNAELDPVTCCSCATLHTDFFAVVADGVDAVRAATREQLRRGASHIKIMASGGVLSPRDPIDRCQFSDAEIRTVVEETERWGAYVAAHCHPTAAVRRCVELGVRSIEHGSLIDAETADFCAARGAFVVPTLAGAFAFHADPLLTKPSQDKLSFVVDRMLSGLSLMERAGVRMGFGTDLLGPHYLKECTEFTLRSQVQRPLEILRSACSVNAELLQQSGRLGCIRPGAYADLLVVDGNPLENIALLAQDGARLSVILAQGRFHKRTI
ncbi:MAG TPA: amidohydrolase family protein [Steroidobacteraceae bacterium]|nr:amidohydrolase family protein [Steroidobacteraceae bacterium]